MSGEVGTCNTCSSLLESRTALTMVTVRLSNFALNTIKSEIKRSSCFRLYRDLLQDLLAAI